MGPTKKLLIVLILAINILKIQSRSISLGDSNENPILNPSNFERTETIGEGFRVTWQVDFEEEIVTFDLEVETKGYVGFGFSKENGMDDADLIIGGVLDDKSTYFEDRFAKGHIVGLDKVQNWEFIEATETGETTHLKFRRDFDTGDADEDKVIDDEITYFIWAKGSADDIAYHAERGTFEVRILEEPSETTEIGVTGAYDDDEDFIRTKKFNENVTVTWEVLFQTQQIIFHVEAKTPGYVGFGISNSGSMTPADLVIGGIRPDKTPYFADRYSNGHSTTVDPSQDWILQEIRQTPENTTYFRVIRDFDTGDSDNDIVITREKTNFIWAIGADDDIERHIARGSFAVNILEPTDPISFVRFEEINSNISVSWEVDPEKEVIVFEVLAKTPGYIGFGLSLDGKMEGMDLIMGGVFDDHTPYFADHFATGHRAPEKDAEQNWFLLAAREEANQTYLKFVRKFDTGDSVGDIPITKDDMFFTWALGATDDIADRHARPMRGAFAVNILQVPSVPTSFERKVELSNDFQLSYNINFLMRRITFEATVASTGYVGFGISPSGSMYNADMIIGGVDDDGISYFDDRFSLKHGVPAVDKYQDWFLKSATEDNQVTRLSFYRNLFTMDTLEDYPILDENTSLVWAIGSSDDLKRHATRGDYKINLFQAREPTTTTTTTTVAPPLKENFQRTETITEGYDVTWDVDFETESVSFELRVKTTGYIGFGFSKDGNMKEADLIFGGVRDDKTSYLEDRFSQASGAPVMDTKQNWYLTEATESSDITVLKFWRGFDTGDSEQDRPILFENTYFIWAIGSTDDIAYHATRGNFPVNILEGSGTGTPTTGAATGTGEPETTPAASLKAVMSWVLLTVAIVINIAM